jgi:hypothetical protein
LTAVFIRISVTEVEMIRMRPTVAPGDTTPGAAHSLSNH